ncbi:hypothetical protein MVES1_002262 [Malassezia vespertilionis]|uniref:Eisosome component PIL1-domain-containing protein n=1 Tax=Malassezia vespertilionis TaxID=2020962 RepID=A0A2N1JC47_9BASI|nr:uncharacterized protein MVES1_002262 [Malassezia vespertilionis]PKI84119.1 hypothetical protein MVES_002134 [Malassezia vespertilionis]WFD06907.1 hypothetical protein MVES1_002262 [Malassezia vespertilionis]
MSLFKKAQTAVAHNSSFPTFGNSELKNLQEWIHAEKLFVAANGKASNEIQKGADSLRTWGSSEGDDMSDVLSKIALLHEHLGRAQLRYNYFVSTMRLHLKSIRSREEAFGDLRNKKRHLASKIEGVEKKLAKMGPENKDLARVTSSLREMRGDMDVLRNEEVHQDAALGDFKRHTVAEAFSLTSGGLMELAEKSVVIAETTRLLSEEIPLGATIPGQVRAPYRNEARTERLLHEAIRQLDTIHFEPHQDAAQLSKEYGSPNVAGANEQFVPSMTPVPTDTAVDAAPGAGAGVAVGTASARSAYGRQSSGYPLEQSYQDDPNRGSQGWVAPGHESVLVHPPQEPIQGLPTVLEGDDTLEFGEEQALRERDAYTSLPVAQAEEHARNPPSYAQDTHPNEHPSRSYGPGFAAQREEVQAYQEPPSSRHAYPESNYAPQEPAPYFQDGGAGPYDAVSGLPSDAIPAYPPMPPGVPLYASLTPISRDSPMEEFAGEGNRAYFEGVGGTKALQAAAARSGNFPMDNFDMNSTPNMFVAGNEGRSFSPSALRPGMGGHGSHTGHGYRREIVQHDARDAVHPVQYAHPVHPVQPVQPVQPGVSYYPSAPGETYPDARVQYPQHEPPAYQPALPDVAHSPRGAAPPVQVGAYLPYVAAPVRSPLV